MSNERRSIRGSMITGSLLSSAISKMRELDEAQAQAVKPLTRNGILLLLQQEAKMNLREGDSTDRLIDLIRKIEQRSFEVGLLKAAEYLQGTASDFTQTSERLLRNNRTATMHERKEEILCEEKAKLLQGQATHILGLKLQ